MSATGQFEPGLSGTTSTIRANNLVIGHHGFKLPNILPALPRKPQTLPNVEHDAINRRVDLQVARIELETIAKSYGLTNATRFVNLFELAGIYKDTRESVGSENVQFRDFGPGATVEIPLFDFGEVRVRQAEQIYMQALNRLTEQAINIRSEARDAYRTYRSAFEIASRISEIFCRYEKSSPMKRSCATTGCLSMSSRCLP